MINQLYIDNYKCFSNFDCKLGSLHVIIGKNGSGKTSVFDVIEKLRDFICIGTKSVDAFSTHTLTAWDTRAEQTFELGVAGNGGQYRYRLIVDHDRKGRRNRIKTERLDFDQKVLYEFDGQEAHLYRDDSSPGPAFPFRWTRSAIPTIPERDDNRLLSWFRSRLERTYIYSPDPLRMDPRSEGELAQLDRPMHKLVSWLRHLTQESVDTVSKLWDCLRDDVFDYLENIRLEKVSEFTRTLKFEFKFPGSGSGKAFSLDFDQLSEGQRNLVALYAILHAGVENDTTICLDEPDNYVALREVQPWLTALRDRVDDCQAQCLLVSHHPEVINYMAANHGLLLAREESGPARAKVFEWTAGDAISPAEIIARGWE